MAFTYFFRDLQTLERVADQLAESAMGRSGVHIWDAGCAMGQEAYSLTILLAECMGRYAFRNVRVHATDIDGSNRFGRVIASGEYPADQTQRIPRPIFEKYFQPCGSNGHSRLDDQIRCRVVFTRQDLLELHPIRDGLSAVVCKNVLLHFRPEQRVEVLRMFHGSLLPGGLLATEQTQKLPDAVAPLFRQLAPDVQIFEKV